MTRILILLLLLGLTKTWAQNVPIGTWQSYFSYRSAQQVLEAGNKIFCSSYNGLFSINPENDSITVYSKANGLHDTGISSMGYDPAERLLLLAYRNGNLDLVYLNDQAEPEKIVNWPFLLESSGLPESKRISKVFFHEQKAYLSTSFGIMVLNPKLLEVTETYRYIGAEGAEVQVSDMAFTPDSLFAVTSQGLLGTSLSAQLNRQYYANWKSIRTPFTAVAATYQNNTLYAGLSGQGLFKKSGAQWELVYASAGPYFSFSNDLLTLSGKILVLNKDKPDVYEHPLFSTLKGSLTYQTFFWAADGKNGLLSNKSGAFRSYAPAPGASTPGASTPGASTPGASTPGDTTLRVQSDSSVVDHNGLVWTRLPENLGGGISVKDPKTNRQRILSVSAGNGGLPSSAINSLALDTEGSVWFASERGIGYFIPDEVFSGTRVDALFPVYGQRKLFANERCNAIAIEPGNRKWIATDNGLFQFNADGTEQIRQFDAKNSPLPSSLVKDLYFEEDTGLLFADTPNGMVSYRSDASRAGENLSMLTIFPNPVRPGYEGNLGIKGLMENSVVKITDLSGRLVYETRSQGGTASWNLNDYTGKRARGGIYLIIVVSSDRSEKMAGKLAIIN